MSPEQAASKKVDARSDIFSFGAVLYEMVTAQRAFQGDSLMEMVAAILNQEPKPLPPKVPHDLTKINTALFTEGSGAALPDHGGPEGGA